MSCSKARMIANRANAAHSTGPKTEAGKCRSRANSLKHGLTGQCVVVPDEDLPEIEARFEAIRDELKPKGGFSDLLTRRLAAITVRLDRSVRQETLMIALNVRHAPEAFDDARLAEADHLLGWIADEPATNRRRLERMPEGIDLLINALQGLRHDLVFGSSVGDGNAASTRWNFHHSQQFDAITGRRTSDFPFSRCYGLTEALAGRFEYLEPAEIASLDDRARRAYARDGLARLIDDQIAGLEASRAAIDHDAITADREESGTRALFDPSPAATLARKYEAASERHMFRLLDKIQELGERDTEPAVEIETEVIPQKQVPARPPTALGSFFPMTSLTGPIAGEAPKVAKNLDQPREVDPVRGEIGPKTDDSSTEPTGLL